MKENLKKIWLLISIFILSVIALFCMFLFRFLGLETMWLPICGNVIILLLSWVFIFLDYKATIKELDDL